MSICEGSTAAFSFDKDAVSFDNLLGQSRLKLVQGLEEGGMRYEARRPAWQDQLWGV